MLKSLEGMSSLEEVLRVTHSEDSEPLTFEPSAPRPTPVLRGSSPPSSTLGAPPAKAAPAKTAPAKEVA